MDDIYTQPSRYNWMFQFYLKAQGLSLSWVGSGRIIMTHNFSEDDYAEVIQRFVVAAKKMQRDGWWWQSELLSNKTIKQQIFKEMIMTRIPALGKLLPGKLKPCRQNKQVEEVGL